MSGEQSFVSNSIDGFNEAIREVWNEKYKTAYFQIVVLAVFACYNFWFTFHTAMTAWEGKGEGSMVRRWAFGKLYLAVGLEAIALSYYSCWCFIHMGARLLHYNPHSGPQSLQFVRALEMVGSFSFFMFLPGPKKLVYWYKNRHVVYEMYWTNPQVLRMTRETTAGATYFNACDQASREFLWSHAFENFLRCQNRQHDPICRCLIGCCKGVLTVSVTFAWFLERRVKPCLIIVFVVFAVPAVILKLAMLPDIDPSDSTHALLKNIFPYLGIILQSSRTWAIREVELCAVLRFDTIMHDEKEPVEDIKARLRLLNIVIDAIPAHLHGFRAMCMFSVLDNAVLALILKKRFGNDAQTKFMKFIERLYGPENQASDRDPERQGTPYLWA